MADKTNFNWRTAPRSIAKLMAWLPYFAQFQQADYQAAVANQEPSTMAKIPVLYPVRRAIRYAIESDADDPDPLTQLTLADFVAGQQPASDFSDKESKVRQIVTTAEQYGLMDAKTARLTPVGQRAVAGQLSGEDFLVQLLKMYVMVDEHHGVFPLRTVLQLMAHFGALSRNELTFVFGTLDDAAVPTTIEAVQAFRTAYAKLPSRNDNRAVEALVIKTWHQFFPATPDRKIISIQHDYTDALRRALEFTELFYSHGRGTAMKLRVSALNQPKLQQLVNDFTFVLPPQQSVNGHLVQKSARETLAWFGAVGNLSLPWDQPDARVQLVEDKLDHAARLFAALPEAPYAPAQVAVIKANLAKASIQQLKDLESALDQAVLAQTELLYVQKEAQTPAARQEILERFETILTDKDQAALWLEVNTWRAFVALSGQDKEVIHHFQMNPDLTPKSFAPGTGNTPDMEVHLASSILVPEVSMMAGTVQWEHEASSVIDHVIKISQASPKPTLGVFISARINQRTLWQLFLLNHDSWLGQPVPVVPLTIKQFSAMMQVAYATDATAQEVATLLEQISAAARQLTTYIQWPNAIESALDAWARR